VSGSECLVVVLALLVALVAVAGLAGKGVLAALADVIVVVRRAVRSRPPKET
jgi:hypothetical protein